MKKSPVVNLFMAVCMILTMNGCSLFAPKSESVSINTAPSGAEVLVNDAYKGTTPCTVNVPCRGATITVRKNGYVPQKHTIGRSLGTCGILDIVGTVICLVPVVGLISSGAYTLDEHTVNLNMQKITEE